MVIAWSARELVNQIVNHRGRENAPQHQDNPGMGMGGGGGDMGNPPMMRGGGGGGGGGGGLAVTVCKIETLNS